MSQVLVGTVANDGTGDPLRTAFQKINQYGQVGDKTVNAAFYKTASNTNEAAITLAIVAAALLGTGAAVWIPAGMLPYNASLVTFNQTVRMIREGSNHAVFDVRAYGAAGDGVTNDTPAFVGAIQGAGTVISPNGPGGQVWIPPTFANIYLLGAAGAMSATEVLQLYGAIRFTAAGGGDASPTLRLANGTNLSLIGIPAPVQGLIIEDIHLDGNAANQSGTSHCLWFKGDGTYKDNRTEVRNVFIEKALTNGVRIDFNTSEIMFDRVLVRNCTGDNWYINGNDNTFLKCDAGTSAAGYGYNIQNGWNKFYGGSSFANALDNVIIASSAVSVGITDMDIDSAQQNGIHLQGNYTYLKGCTFRNSGQQTNLTYYHIQIDSGLIGLHVTHNHIVTKTKANQALYGIAIFGPLTASIVADNTEEATSSGNGDLVTGTPGQGFIYRGAHAAPGLLGGTAFHSRHLEGFATPTWGATVTIDPTFNQHFFVNALTNIVATITVVSLAPGISNTSQEIDVEVKNSSGGALGTAPVFDSAANKFKATGSVVVANGLRIIVRFRYNPTDNVYVETGRTSAAV